MGPGGRAVQSSLEGQRHLQLTEPNLPLGEHERILRVRVDVIGAELASGAYRVGLAARSLASDYCRSKARTRHA